MKKSDPVKREKRRNIKIMSREDKALILHPEVTRQVLKAKIKLEAEKKAYELFERNGKTHGNDLAHWLEAEKELIRQYVWQLI
ncbi:MAG: hypothetical protein A2452_13325 [Candidatus Firestonebacteria bacterium RIFOXYC2_FULL_39_67]|nr:MAG: hypothetical protein A2536_01185 [Candidatus Firestonebacteria bacterium RIFOXYD2_FULL_39_29]OGF56300.1 MAG: hypothetical protein A2452_13325 [Candidatus Firestonebacteria bacterium RIFOXYC2_FULL_39_67]